MPRKHRPSRLPLLLLSLIAPFCVQPAQAQGSVTLQPDGSLLYSGDAARFSIGYSKGGKFQGELSGVLHEQANTLPLRLRGVDFDAGLEAVRVASGGEQLLCLRRIIRVRLDGGVEAKGFRLNRLALVHTGELDGDPWLKGLGPEPLGNGFNAGVLKSAFKAKKQNVKASLLDQRIVAGLGNIYVVEALYRSQISPLTPAGKVSMPRLERLTTAIRDVLTEAVAAGGSTIGDFANAEGGQGYFQHRFDVYGREGDPCLRDGCKGVIKRVVQAGRSTFWCGTCQK